MGPQKGDRKLKWFEEILRRDVEDHTFDYSSVELGLTTKVDAVEQLGALGILKLDEIPPEELLEKVNQELFSRIHQFREYEEPVNECIKHSEELPSSRWNMIEESLSEKITSLESREPWEQFLMTDQQRSFGDWERQEEFLFSSLSGVDKRDRWETAAKSDEVAQPSTAEVQERALDQMLASTSELSDWEKYLRGEMVLPCAYWEEAESRLFERIEHNASGVSMAHQPFWIFIEYYARHLKAAAGVLSMALVLGAAVWAGLHFRPVEESLPTFVYQVQGTAAERVSLSDFGRSQYASLSGGAVTLVNNHGFLELQNGSSVQIEQLSPKSASYKVSNSEKAASSGDQGRVVFFVNKQENRKQFQVNTPDYTIQVTGTYFSVEPDESGRLATRVFEGTVQIKSPKETIMLNAGQSYQYDPDSSSYVIKDGGTVIPRQEIDQVPDPEQIKNYRVLMVRSSVPGAMVRIDGRYFGTTPLAMYQSRGEHRIWVGKDGFNSVDTIISVGSDSVCLVEVAPSEIKKVRGNWRKPAPAQNPPVRKNERPVVENRPVAENQLQSETPEVSSENYRRARDAELKGSFKEAISLYDSVFNDHSARRVYREDALFSIGKLKAEHVSVADAKEVFLAYLALFPRGIYAGESWLRLAELEFASNQERSLGYYHKFLEQYPRHHRASELQNRVGLIYLQLGRYVEAAEMFRQSLANITPGQKKERKNILLNLHHALKAAGDEYSSEAVWRQYLAEVNMPVGR